MVRDNIMTHSESDDSKKRGEGMLERLGHLLKYAYKLFKVYMQMLRGLWKISRFSKPIVSIFGGARLKKDDPYFTQISEFAHRLTNNNVSVITGGGGGAMEAANCGAIKPGKGNGTSIGISVSELGEGRNMCVEEYLVLDYFFGRKWLMTHFSKAFIIFPGGYGTLDELMEVLTLISTKKMMRAPVVLVGVEYWQPFMKWLRDEPMNHGLLSEEGFALITLTDDLEYAFCVIRDRCAY